MESVPTEAGSGEVQGGSSVPIDEAESTEEESLDEFDPSVLPVAHHYVKMASDLSSTAVLPPLDVIPEDKIWEQPEPEELAPDVVAGGILQPAPGGLDTIHENERWDHSNQAGPDEPLLLSGQPVHTAAAAVDALKLAFKAQAQGEDELKIGTVGGSQYSSVSDLHNLEYYRDIDAEEASYRNRDPYWKLRGLQNYSEPQLAQAGAESRVTRLLKQAVGLFRPQFSLSKADSRSTLSIESRPQDTSRRGSGSFRGSAMGSTVARSDSVSTGISTGSSRQNLKIGRARAGGWREKFRGSRLQNRELSASSLQSSYRFQRAGSSVSLRHCNEPPTPDMRAEVVKMYRMPWPCRECPACRRNTLGEGRLRPEMIARKCQDCRICQILYDGPDADMRREENQEADAGRRHQHEHSHGDYPFTSEIGALCVECRKTRMSKASLRDGLCSRMSSVNLQQTGSEASLSLLAATAQQTIPSVRSNVSLASVVSLGPICRICHFGLSDSQEPLFSPCRCSGSLSFVHHSCLVHWLDISVKKLHKLPICELCHYRYSRHKVFRMKEIAWPKIKRRDKILHCVFFVALLIMLACGATTIICFSDDYRNLRSREEKPPVSATHGGSKPGTTNNVPSEELSYYEVVTLVAGVLFFAAFFIAMGSQVKARLPLHRYVAVFVRKNQSWIIDPYDPERDKKPGNVPEKGNPHVVTTPPDPDLPIRWAGGVVTGPVSRLTERNGNSERNGMDVGIQTPPEIVRAENGISA